MAESKAVAENTAAEVTVENTAPVASNGDFFSKNQNTILTLVGVVLVAVMGYYGYRYYVEQQDNEAQAQMFRSQFYFENDSLDRALNGAGGNPGFLTIIEDYSGTPAANLSHFYVGAIYLKKGKFNEAVEHLKSFSSSDLLVAPRAKALLGDAYMELNQLEDAISAYKAAADLNPNKFFTPTYLMKLALAQTKNNDKAGAIATYDKLLKEYGDQGDAADAKKYKAMLEQETGAGQ